MTKKLLVVVGVTGNQGGSVAYAFLSNPAYRIRGVTRNPSSPAAQSLVSQGIEIVVADLDDPKSLEKAFKGANLIFSVTNYWEPFFRPDCRAKAEESGVGCRKFAYEVEYRKSLHFGLLYLGLDSLRERRSVSSLVNSWMIMIIWLQDKERTLPMLLQKLQQVWTRMASLLAR